VLGVQTLIAEAVAGSVAGRLLPVERKQVARLPTTNPLAYDHYLRGNQLLVGETEAGVLGAIGEYEAALNLDSTFTSALGHLAYSYALALNWAYRPAGLSPASILSRAVAAADRAIRSDSTNADAWAGKGVALFYTGKTSDVGAAAEALERAVKLDPSSEAAHHWYAVILRRSGQFREAEQEYHRALAIDPNQAWSAADLGFIAMSQRSFPVAVNWYDRALRIDSTVASLHLMAAHARVGARDFAGAVGDARIGLTLAEADERYRALATLSEMETRAGDRASGAQHFQQALRGLEGSAGALPDSVGVRDAWQFALAAVALGEHDLAIRILQRTTPRGPWLWSYIVLEGFDPIRDDPRFRAIINEARPPGAKDPG
jgi:tetratricopeptide (TPR) repeat protein